jgi:hypothetical protein
MIRTLVVLVCTTLIASLTFAHGNERHVIGTVAKVSFRGPSLSKQLRKPT